MILINCTQKFSSILKLTFRSRVARSSSLLDLVFLFSLCISLFFLFQKDYSMPSPSCSCLNCPNMFREKYNVWSLWSCISLRLLPHSLSYVFVFSLTSLAWNYYELCSSLSWRGKLYSIIEYKIFNTDIYLFNSMKHNIYVHKVQNEPVSDVTKISFLVKKHINKWYGRRAEYSFLREAIQFFISVF